MCVSAFLQESLSGVFSSLLYREGRRPIFVHSSRWRLFGSGSSGFRRAWRVCQPVPTLAWRSRGACCCSLRSQDLFFLLQLRRRRLGKSQRLRSSGRRRWSCWWRWRLSWPHQGGYILCLLGQASQRTSRLFRGKEAQSSFGLALAEEVVVLWWGPLLITDIDFALVSVRISWCGGILTVHWLDIPSSHDSVTYKALEGHA